MCTKPMIKEGQTFACRSCDECISVHKFDWISRAMMEKEVHPYSTVITLTYNNETQESRDGAAMFRYADVAGFLKRLRRAIAYRVKKERLNASPEVRFIVAGEQGSRTGRCHWHIVLFSHVDVTQFGDFSAPWGEVKDRKDIISRNSANGRRSWTLWPHGYCHVMEPDEGAMAYVLKYCVKDQFDTAKSQGQSRYTKSEQYASGMFRMSKRPPLGWPYIQAMLDDMKEHGYCPPKLVFRVRGSKGFWWPRGPLRKKILEHIGLINSDYIEKHGRNLPQWSTLLHNLQDNESDLEALLNGPQEEDQDDREELENTFRKREAWSTDEHRRSIIAHRCGSSYPCSPCLAGHTPETLRRIGVVEVWDDKTKSIHFEDTEGRSITERQKDGKAGGCNGYCLCSQAPSVKKVFPQSARGYEFG